MVWKIVCSNSNMFMIIYEDEIDKRAFTFEVDAFFLVKKL